MPEPPPQLIALVGRLGLAAPAEIRKAEKHVRRLARDLPQFESVWIDALAQARLLTPFQAAQLNAGRGQSLRVGPYLLCQPLSDCPWIACYRARHVESGDMARLAVADAGDQTAEELLPRLQALAAAADRLTTEHLLPILRADRDGGRIWAAARWLEGRTAAAWMVHHGRFPPDAVLEIARAMTAGLLVLEEAGLCHGDVAAQSLLLTGRGGVALLQPGLRPILRPEEGYAHADLQPEAYDYLAPERIAAGASPDTAGDVYACGCLWWHLLCGRPPLAGGDSLAKLRAGHAATIVDVRRFAPAAPGLLVETIAACVRREPAERPGSIAQLAEMLGRPARNTRQTLARDMGRYERPAAPWATPTAAEQAANRTSRRMALAALALMAVVAGLWPLWQQWHRSDAPAAAVSTAAGGGAGRASQGTQGVPGPIFVATTRSVVPESGQSPERKLGQSPAYATPGVRPARTAEGAPDLLLDAKRAWEGAALSLRPGQCVRGALGKRPSVVVPRGGLIVAVDRVRFENIDFVWTPATAAAAMIELRAGHGEFRGCTFQAVPAASAPPAAIAWIHPAAAVAARLALPSGQLRLSDCVFRGVAAAIDCRTRGALDVELTNTLHLGGGPVLRLDHCPRIEEPLSLSITRVTLRGTGPLLQCDCPRQDDRPGQAGTEQPPAGEIAVEAAGCVLAPAAGQPLLLFAGRNSPVRALAGVKWTGQGSLVLPDAPIAAWRRPDGRQQLLDEAAVSMAGLVRSTVAFAGSAEDGPAASRIVRWQAPLQSADAPGVAVELLPHR